MVKCSGITKQINRTIKILLLITTCWSKYLYAYEVSLFAPINAINIQGNVTFHQQSENSPVQISIHLNYVRQPKQSDIEEKFEWLILSNPVIFGNGPNSCNRNELGKSEFELSKKHGEIIMTANGTNSNFINHEINLQGKNSIWGRSLLIKSLSSNAREACTNIMDAKGEVRTAEAQFVGEISGLVVFRENERGETLIFSNLYYTSDDYKSSSKNDWKLYTTDIFDRKTTRSCHYLSLLLDPLNTKDDDCSPDNHSGCKMGDLTRKHRQLTIGAQNNRFSKQIFLDLSLPLSFIEGSSRSIFLVIMEKNNNNKISACAKLNMIRAKEVKAIISSDGVEGHFQFAQRHWLDPTIVSIKLNNLQKRGKYYSINEFPLRPIISKNQSVCEELGEIFNPFKIRPSKQAVQLGGTNDEFAIGDLSSKFGSLNSFEENYLAIYTDFNLPLFGLNSVIGRSISIRNANDNWICGTIQYPGKLITAIATFYFPVYGKIILRQEIDKPYGETTVLAELNYSDGQLNNTINHDWKLHESFAGRDFYNWSKRCDSTGQIYNPVKIGNFKYNQKCNKENPRFCKIGDLLMKSGQKLKIIADKKSESFRIFYTDVILPLQGPYSVVGRSIVIMDDQAPKQRGNRLACATIFRQHELAASVREWKTSVGIKSNVTGSISFNQETLYDPTEVKINLHGLNGLASNYHLHEIWVPNDKLFPCSFDSVGAYYNPLELDNSISVLPGKGSKDQYEVGDLGSKYGLLSGKTHEKKEIIDTSLSLHGLNSIVGRSVVINKEERNFQWTCGTIKAEIRRDEGRELIAMASFHNEKDEIEGFVRFRQFEYKDGSLSNTFLEVNLKYAGDFNRNVTRNHKWSVYVNQVGADAYIEVKNVRCLAGGYSWNPYLVESKSERYVRDCKSQSQLRCEMGDLSGKLGKLTIGEKPMLFVDENLPLIGNFSVMFRSLIIFDKDDSENNKIACANILPDIQLIGSVTVKKNPSFTVEKFMNHMRKQLNTKKWLVEADISNTNYILKGECVQITVRFYGSEAHRLQIEFSNLINLGSVVRQSNGRQEIVHTFYKPCKSLEDLTEEGLNSLNNTSHTQLSLINLIFILSNFFTYYYRFFI